jgi:L-ascorbate metabolism protein UlaG (beta-lactamase superfamily)
MKDKKNRYVPAVRDGRYESQLFETKEEFLLTTISMIVKSFMFRLNPWQKDKITWSCPGAVLDRSEQLSITWIGHSTFLIQIGGINILTDPIFGNSSFFYRRIIEPGIAFERLPAIDIVLVSHNHIDHMETSTIVRLAKEHRPLFIVPQGDKQWFDQRKINRVKEFCWWEALQYEGVRLGTNLTCTFLPAVHWTQRWINDRNRSLWGSWMLECAGKRIYFAGDTAFGQHFEAIAKEFPVIDTAIMPIGPCEPRNIMKFSHMDALEACRAFALLKARHFIPMHWGTFHFGIELAQTPLERLRQNWATLSLSEQGYLHEPSVGKPIIFNN